MNKPLPDEMKLSEFMKLTAGKERWKKITELRDGGSDKYYKLINYMMLPYRLEIRNNEGYYIHGYSYTEPRKKNKVPERLQAVEDKVWIPTFKFRMEKVKIINN